MECENGVTASDLDEKKRFDRIEVTAEMYEETLRRLRAKLPFHSGLYNSRHLPAPEEYTLGMKIEVDSLTLEALLSQPLPPSQYDLLQRRSPVVGRGLEEA